MSKSERDRAETAAVHEALINRKMEKKNNRRAAEAAYLPGEEQIARLAAAMFLKEHHICINHF